jgi:hypothetical protein
MDGYDECQLRWATPAHFVIMGTQVVTIYLFILQIRCTNNFYF